MAVSDVFSLAVEIALPDSPTTINFHYQETNPSDSAVVHTQALAVAWEDQMMTPLLAMLSTSATTGGVRVRKLGSPAAAPGYATSEGQGNEGAGSILPANNGARLSISQSFFPSRSNGMVWIPGVSEGSIEGNNYKQAWLDGPAQSFIDALLQDIVETPNTGLWRLGVLSRKHLIANPGDYAGAFADATGASMSPIVGTQRRRTTKRRGGALNRFPTV